jgi:hypothetical protein
VLALQAREPRRLLGPAQLGRRAFGQRQVEGGVPLPYRSRLAARQQALPRVLPDSFQHGEAGAAAAVVLAAQQTLLQQQLEPVQHARGQ